MHILHDFYNKNIIYKHRRFRNLRSSSWLQFITSHVGELSWRKHRLNVEKNSPVSRITATSLADGGLSRIKMAAISGLTG